MTQVQHGDLTAVRGALQSRRNDLTQRKLRVARDLTHREEALSANTTEQAIETQNDETLQAILDSTVAELVEIDEALQRMDHGSYGMCRDCGQSIAPLRLATLPQAVTCASCAQ
jgi:RNA polymerase-binding transcription factor DksA